MYLLCIEYKIMGCTQKTENSMERNIGSNKIKLMAHFIPGLRKTDSS